MAVRRWTFGTDPVRGPVAYRGHMPTAARDLTGKSAVVSGSTQGIGRAIAVGLARAGAAVTVNGRDRERVDRVVAELRGDEFLAGDSAVVIPVEMVHYGVTKTALLGVSRGFAKTLAATGVTVNAVIAGPTHTEGVEAFVRELVGDELPWEEAQRAFIAEHRPTSLIGRLIEPEEIAAMCVHLASEGASATTGGALRVDGGFVDTITL